MLATPSHPPKKTNIKQTHTRDQCHKNKQGLLYRRAGLPSGSQNLRCQEKFFSHAKKTRVRSYVGQSQRGHQTEKQDGTEELERRVKHDRAQDLGAVPCQSCRAMLCRDRRRSRTVNTIDGVGGGRGSEANGSSWRRIKCYMYRISMVITYSRAWRVYNMQRCSNPKQVAEQKRGEQKKKTSEVSIQNNIAGLLLIKLGKLYILYNYFLIADDARGRFGAPHTIAMFGY